MVMEDDEKDTDGYMKDDTCEPELEGLMVLIVGHLREMGLQEDTIVALGQRFRKIRDDSFLTILLDPRNIEGDASHERERVDERSFQSYEWSCHSPGGTTVNRSHVRESNLLPHHAGSQTRKSTRKNGSVSLHTSFEYYRYLLARAH
jgi:hypothetical protein